MRFYGFKVDEIVDDLHPDLDLELDPKSSYALRNPHLFPVDVNVAAYEMILRIPGVGVRSAKKIVASRKHGKLRMAHLKKIGVVLKRAKYFILCADKDFKFLGQKSDLIRQSFIRPTIPKTSLNQLSLF